MFQGDISVARSSWISLVSNKFAIGARVDPQNRCVSQRPTVRGPSDSFPELELQDESSQYLGRKRLSCDPTQIRFCPATDTKHGSSPRFHQSYARCFQYRTFQNALRLLMVSLSVKDSFRLLIHGLRSTSIACLVSPQSPQASMFLVARQTFIVRPNILRIYVSEHNALNQSLRPPQLADKSAPS